jgi:hypothetical protein
MALDSGILAGMTAFFKINRGASWKNNRVFIFLPVVGMERFISA